MTWVLKSNRMINYEVKGPIEYNHTNTWAERSGASNLLYYTHIIITHISNKNVVCCQFPI